MRQHWMDNLRWTTVVSVLIYHVFYFYNDKGVLGGIGGFGSSQPQDVLMYVLYPWFMMLLFLVAGIGSRYYLEKHSLREFIRSRTLKLLVPSTIGLFVFQWITGYFNILTAGYVQGISIFAQIPEPARPIVGYLISVLSGTGPLWFIQVLWLLSLLLALLKKIDSKDKLWQATKHTKHWVILLCGLLVYLGSQTLIKSADAASLASIYNGYKPLCYAVPFLLGYYLFSHQEVQEKLLSMTCPLCVAALLSGIWLVLSTYGQNFTDPVYLASPLCNLYAYLMILALMAIFKKYFNRTNAFATYMTKSSFGIYIVHYVIIVAFGYMLKVHTQLPVFAIYLILLAAVLLVSPLLYEILRRIPIVRWCVFGRK